MFDEILSASIAKPALSRLAGTPWAKKKNAKNPRLTPPILSPENDRLQRLSAIVRTVERILEANARLSAYGPKKQEIFTHSMIETSITDLEIHIDKQLDLLTADLLNAALLARKKRYGTRTYHD